MREFVRKVCSVLFLSVLMASLILQASAVDSCVTLTPSATALKIGDVFTVEAVLDNSDKISLGTVVLRYDENALELTGGVCHVSGTMVGQVIPNQKAGTFLLAMPKKVSGKLFTFTFRVKPDAVLGAYEITAQAAAGTTGGNYIDATGTRVTVGSGNVQPDQNTGGTTLNTDGSTQPSQSNSTVQNATDATAPVIQIPLEKDNSLWWLCLIIPVATGVVAVVIYLKRKK